ncbi:MAG: murein hydrolase activator EnvC [Actinomycetota bacterium]
MPKLVARRLTSLLFVLVALVGTVALPATADPSARLEEIAERQAELDRRLAEVNAKASRLLQTIGQLDARAADVEGDLASLDARLTKLTARIGVVSDRLTATQKRMTQLTEDLAELTLQFEESEDLFVARAIEAYKAGPSASFEGLLAAESITDLLTRFEYYESTLDSDAELLEEIDRMRTLIEDRRAEVDKRQTQIAADKRRLESHREAIQAVRTERGAALSALQQILGQKNDLLAQAEQKRREYLEAKAQFERESDHIRYLLSGGSTAPAGSGQLGWPAAGEVTSGYGWRTHPIFGDQRFHAGIDIGAPYGATVYASEAGTVAFVGAMSGYGNVIVVDHHNGLATTYNHLSAFSVGSGQTVGRGAPIGAVGCSGYCTGPHLHFEVRVNGDPVDPMPYLQ